MDLTNHFFNLLFKGCSRGYVLCLHTLAKRCPLFPSQKVGCWPNNIQMFTQICSSSNQVFHPFILNWKKYLSVMRVIFSNVIMQCTYYIKSTQAAIKKTNLCSHERLKYLIYFIFFSIPNSLFCFLL